MHVIEESDDSEGITLARQETEGTKRASGTIRKSIIRNSYNHPEEAKAEPLNSADKQKKLRFNENVQLPAIDQKRASQFGRISFNQFHFNTANLTYDTKVLPKPTIGGGPDSDFKGRNNSLMIFEAPSDGVHRNHSDSFSINPARLNGAQLPVI